MINCLKDGMRVSGRFYKYALLLTAVVGMCLVDFGGVDAATSTASKQNTTQNDQNPATYTWTEASGSLSSTSGEAWVSGSGTLDFITWDPFHDDENSWTTAWYGHDMDCEITCEAPIAKWVINASCSMWLKSYATSNNQWGDADCRAETTGVVEMKGDFEGFDATQVAVDTYTDLVNEWEEYEEVGEGQTRKHIRQVRIGR